MTSFVLDRTNNYFLSVVILVTTFLIAGNVYAQPFLPGSTLDPNCSPYLSPGVVNTLCKVASPSGGPLIGSTSSVNSETWLGEDAGSGVVSDNTVFIGKYAGKNASGITSTTVGVGAYSFSNASSAPYATAVGYAAGSNSTTAHAASLFGHGAGSASTNVDGSSFFGMGSGVGGDNISNSNFFGAYSGKDADNARNSIFIGFYSGFYDTVSNGTNDHSILIGDNTNTGGFSNSIAIGTGAINTATNQFLIDDSYTQFSMRGLNYTMPNTLATSNGQALVSDTFGNLSWGTSPVGNSLIGSTSGIVTGSTPIGPSEEVYLGEYAGSGMIVSPVQGQGQGPVLIGGRTGSNASLTSGSSPVMIGRAAGEDSVNIANAVIIGNRAGNNIKTDVLNSIIIGAGAGENDTFSSGSSTDASILLGQGAKAKGYANSIAFGNFAENTASNQFMIGSSASPIEELYVTQSGGTACILNSSGVGCSSDERLKTNITDLNSVLEKILNLRTVTFNWKNKDDGKTNIGFIAQNMQDVFPELVTEQSNGYLSVNYAGITPILAKAIQELNAKVDVVSMSSGIETETLATTISDLISNAVSNLHDITVQSISSISATFEKVTTDLLSSKKIETSELCVDDICVTRDEFKQLVERLDSPSSSSSNQSTDSPPTEEPSSIVTPEIIPLPTADPVQ